MITGVFPISRASLVNRELRCQGTSLEDWATNHGLPLEYVEDVLNDVQRDDGHIEAELAVTLGVSVAALAQTGT